MVLKSMLTKEGYEVDTGRSAIYSICSYICIGVCTCAQVDVDYGGLRS